MTTTAWVIGGRGLLGRATSAHIVHRLGWKLLAASPMPWSDSEALLGAVRSTTRDLLAGSSGNNSTWAIIWAAGAAITSSSQKQLDSELAQLELILATIRSELPLSARRGSIFYASSAGGVYGGSANPPFSELTAPVPISPYGEFKLRAETLVQSFAARESLSCLVGRIANLYGPGQKLEKVQGIISHVAKAQMSPTPASIYVSLDTIRDYIFVKDCAELICDALDRLDSVTEKDSPVGVTKILASGEGTTIATLLGYFRTLSKGHPHVMLGSSASANLQAHDLRLRSVVWPELDYRDLTPLPAGIYATILDILSGIQAGPGAR
ncbi:NAD-dependent epimerase/dehydratase family protein [Frigoribacterium sp. CG_9.8]|uniref:NAD-dependent epimerase/dehydratase family protein n=1 Tax=Frigoribacterium sp. CG_9.8 TaxID=2787733 RepID=UPI0018C9591C